MRGVQEEPQTRFQRIGGLFDASDPTEHWKNKNPLPSDSGFLKDTPS
jgi:hypothetical protein